MGQLRQRSDGVRDAPAQLVTREVSDDDQQTFNAIVQVSATEDASCINI